MGSCIRVSDKKTEFGFDIILGFIWICIIEQIYLLFTEGCTVSTHVDKYQVLLAIHSVLPRPLCNFQISLLHTLYCWMVRNESVFCLDSQSISNGADILGVSHCGWQVPLFLASFDGAKLVVLVFCDHPKKELHLLSSLLFRSAARRLMLSFFGHLILHFKELQLNLRELVIVL